MVLKLQMKLKQKLGVAAIFALGFFVIIASSKLDCLDVMPWQFDYNLTIAVIRAFYSKKMETMLTCTVSMIETAVAIIAASLPGTPTLNPSSDHQRTNIFL